MISFGKTPSYTLILVAAFVMRCFACDYADSVWRGKTAVEKSTMLSAPSLDKMNADCFSAFLGRLAQGKNTLEEALTITTRYCRIHQAFDPALFHYLAGRKELVKNRKLITSLVSLWMNYNGPFQALISDFENRGAFTRADTLYQDLYTLSLLNGPDLLQWAHTKEVIGEYTQAASLYCTLTFLENRRYIYEVQNQFLRMVEEAGTPEVRLKIITAYRSCLFSEPATGGDSLWISNSLANLYDRFSFFPQQVEAVLSLDNDIQSKTQRLYKIAQTRFAQGVYTQVTEPAKRCWEFTKDNTLKGDCAILLSGAYLKTANNDSALIWFEQTDKKNIPSPAVISAYQEKRKFAQADTLISRMPESLQKDTFQIRQLFFQERPSKALIALQNVRANAPWKTQPPDYYFWMLRAGVFGKNTAQTILYLDSLHGAGFAASWVYTPEILNFSIAGAKLQDYPDAFEFWCEIQYNSYIDKTDNITVPFKGTSWPEHVRNTILCSFADALIQKRAYLQAGKVLALVPDSTHLSQLTFYKAVVITMTGDTAKAKSMFEEIIVNDPENIFAQKARIYLLKLKNRSGVM